MKVLQIIDSLEAGGAERIAVNTANALFKAGIESHLCATRKQGILKDSLEKSVGYTYLNRKGPIGISGMYRLYKYIQKHQITHLHAHATSFLTAVVMKFFMRRLFLIWHDHYGNRVNQTPRENRILIYSSFLFDAVITVNEAMKSWAEKHLKSSKITVLENFVTMQKSKEKHVLLGKSGKRMVCLANLRPDKDHLNLIYAFAKIVADDKEWSLILVGKDFHDGYSSGIKKVVQDKYLQERIQFMGSQSDIYGICSSVDIAIISSRSEGLPVALLEYGLCQLPVITTEVGACAEVVKSHGIIVPSQDPEALYQAMKQLVLDKALRNSYAQSFHDHVVKHYGSERYIEQLINVYAE